MCAPEEVGPTDCPLGFRLICKVDFGDCCTQLSYCSSNLFLCEQKVFKLLTMFSRGLLSYCESATLSATLLLLRLHLGSLR